MVRARETLIAANAQPPCAMEAMGVVVNARLAGLLGPAGRGRSWTALSIEWPLPKAVNLTSAIFTFHTLTVGVAQCVTLRAAYSYLCLFCDVKVSSERMMPELHQRQSGSNGPPRAIGSAHKAPRPPMGGGGGGCAHRV